MKNKLTIITAMIILLGIISSGLGSAEYAGTINNISGIYIIDFVAGSTTTANLVIII